MIATQLSSFLVLKHIFSQSVIRVVECESQFIVFTQTHKMSEECELEVEYEEVDAQEVIDDIDGLVDTEFHEEIVPEDDDNIVIQEEVVIHNDNNSSVGNEYEEQDIEFEEEIEANDGDDEEPNEGSDNNDVMSADDQSSAVMAEDNSINADSNNDNDLVIDQNNSNQEPEEGEDGEEGNGGEEKVGENEVYQWSAFTGLRVKVLIFCCLLFSFSLIVCLFR